MEKEFESILVEFDALWGGADANSNKQASWRKELVTRLVQAAEQSVQRTRLRPRPRTAKALRSRAVNASRSAASLNYIKENMNQPYKVSTQENSDNLRNEAYTLIQQAFNVPEGLANPSLNRLVDCIISAAVLQVAALQEKAAEHSAHPTLESGRELPAEVVKSESVLPAKSG